MLGRLDGNGATASETKIPSASLVTGSTAHWVPLHLRGHPCFTIRRSRPDRAGPLRDYCAGLVMPCERKSVEPMAAITAPGRKARSNPDRQSSDRWVSRGNRTSLQTGDRVIDQSRRRVLEESKFPTRRRSIPSLSLTRTLSNAGRCARRWNLATKYFWPKAPMV